MNAPTVASVAGQPAVASHAPAPKRKRAPYRQFAEGGGGRGGTGPASGKTAAGSEARRRAAVILEVLAGVQTPTSAAQALGIGAPRYYLLEQQALEGLLAACEPRPKGRTMNSDRQIARLERELATSRRELGRQQALARAAQRVLGLKIVTVPAVTAGAGKTGAPGKGPPPRTGTGGKKSRKRKPVVRALRAARVLNAGAPPTNSPADSSISAAVGEVQNRTGDALPAGGGNHSAGSDAAELEMQGAQGG